MEYQKTAEATGHVTSNNIANYQEVHHRIIQKQLQMTLIKKYLKKDIYSRRKT